MKIDNGKHVCMLPKEPECFELPPTAGFCRYQIHKIRETALACQWHHGTTTSLRSHKSLKIQRKRHLSLGNCIIWHPYSPICFYWGCFYMFLTFAVFLYMPLQVFYNCPDPFDRFILFSDLTAFLNVCIGFLTGYLDEDNKIIVLEPKLIARHYLRTTFLPDLIGALPLQLINPFENCRYPSHTVMFIFKLFRLVTLRKAWRSLLEQLELSYVKKAATTVIVQIVLFFHWMTFLHYQVPSLCVHFYKSEEQLRVWLTRFNVGNVQNNSIIDTYIANLYVASGLIIGAGYYSPVDKHLVPDLIVILSMGLVGLAFLIYSFTNLLRLAIYMQIETCVFSGRLKALEEYMAMKRLPKFLQRKIQLFINYKYNGHYYNEQCILNTINEQIKQDINMHCCKRLVMNVPLFQDLPIALVNAIIFNLTQILYMPGEEVVRCGQPGSSLYMICSGTVAVMNYMGREMAHLRDGSYFGETTLLHPGTDRTATIIGLEITEIYKLKSEDFQACLQPYPHLKRRLEESYPKRRLSPQKKKLQHT